MRDLCGCGESENRGRVARNAPDEEPASDAPAVATHKHPLARQTHKLGALATRLRPVPFSYVLTLDLDAPPPCSHDPSAFDLPSLSLFFAHKARLAEACFIRHQASLYSLTSTAFPGSPHHPERAFSGPCHGNLRVNTASVSPHRLRDSSSRWDTAASRTTFSLRWPGTKGPL